MNHLIVRDSGLATFDHLKHEAQNNEYISLYRDTIVYRNISPKWIYDFIEDIHNRRDYGTRYRLLLVRQLSYELQLMWAGDAPQEYLCHMKPIMIQINLNPYQITRSMTIGQECKGWNNASF